MEREEKLKALDAALSQIERQFGKGAVMKLGDPASTMNVETIPTGSLSFPKDVLWKSSDRNLPVKQP